MSRRSHSFLSPKALAEAIGVSESSVKRWADDGRIQIQRTSGGHRRIPLAEAARFVREERLTLADPASLGLVVPHHLEAAADPIEAALRGGATTELHDLLASRYLAGEPLASLFDGPLAHGLAAVGELWNSDDSGIFVEHRASAAVRDAHDIARRHDIGVIRDTLQFPARQSEDTVRHLAQFSLHAVILFWRRSAAARLFEGCNAAQALCGA